MPSKISFTQNLLSNILPLNNVRLTWVNNQTRTLSVNIWCIWWQDDIGVNQILSDTDHTTVPLAQFILAENWKKEASFCFLFRLVLISQASNLWWVLVDFHDGDDDEGDKSGRTANKAALHIQTERSTKGKQTDKLLRHFHHIHHPLHLIVDQTGARISNLTDSKRGEPAGRLKRQMWAVLVGGWVDQIIAAT